MRLVSRRELQDRRVDLGKAAALEKAAGRPHQSAAFFQKRPPPGMGRGAPPERGLAHLRIFLENHPRSLVARRRSAGGDVTPRRRQRAARLRSASSPRPYSNHYQELREEASRQNHRLGWAPGIGLKAKDPS